MVGQCEARHSQRLNLLGQLFTLLPPLTFLLTVWQQNHRPRVKLQSSRSTATIIVFIVNNSNATDALRQQSGALDHGGEM